MFVEAHTVGQDDWTTLPDKNGHTDTNSVGRLVRHRLGHDPPVPRPLPDQPDAGRRTAPTRARPARGTRATGNSGGFQDWEIDLTAYKGKQVEVSITYAQDFAIAGLGVFLDALQVRQGRRGDRVQRASRPASPRGSPARSPRAPRTTAAWVARGAVGFTEGPGIATEDTLLWGFGLEGVTTRAERAAVAEGRGHVPHAARGPTRRRRPARRPPPTARASPGGGRRHRAGDAVADARPGRDVRPVHPGPREDVLRRPRRRTSSPPRVTRCSACPTRPRSAPATWSTARSSCPSRSRPGPATRPTPAPPTTTSARRLPLNLLTWNGPVSNDAVTLEFCQLVKANDPLRTGTYSKALTFTLSTTQP